MSDHDLEEILQSIFQAKRLAQMRGWTALSHLLELALAEAGKTARKLAEAETFRT
jgi:hypothetical protein